MIRKLTMTLLLALGSGLAATAGAADAADYTAPVYDMGNVAWMMTATALVLFMSLPGLALFYGGMVRKKNVLNTMGMPLLALSVV